MSDNTSILFSVYLRKYGVNKNELELAISKGEIQSRKLGSNIFLEDKPISTAKTPKKTYNFSRHNELQKKKNPIDQTPINQNSIWENHKLSKASWIFILIVTSVTFLLV